MPPVQLERDVQRQQAEREAKKKLQQQTRPAVGAPQVLPQDVIEQALGGPVQEYATVTPESEAYYEAYKATPPGLRLVGVTEQPHTREGRPTGYTEYVATYQPEPALPGTRFVPGVGYVSEEQAAPKIVATYVKEEKPVFIPTQLFGPKTAWYNPATGQRFEQLGYGSKAPVVEIVKGMGVSPHEASAITGLSLATTMATGIAVPKLGAVALGGTGVAETVKVAVTGKHLTVEEAVMVAGASTLIGYGAMKTYPYAKAGVQKLGNYLNPENDMLKRVGIEPQAETPMSLGMKVKGVFAPKEASAFKHFKPYVGGKSTDLSSGGIGKSADIITGGGAGKFVQQQVLVRQAPAVKAAMKPFTAISASPKLFQVTASVLAPQAKPKAAAKTTQKAKTSLIQTSMTRTIQQQTANPFLQFQGKPYPQRTRSREEEELAFPILYPAKSPLASPSAITRQSASQRQLYRQVESLMLGQTQTPSLVQSQKPAQQTAQVQKLLQSAATTQKQITQQKQIPRIPSYPLGGGVGGSGSYRKLFGVWRPRTHKVKTPRQQLETFGLAGRKIKIPKAPKIPAPKVALFKAKPKRKKAKRKRRK